MQPFHHVPILACHSKECEELHFLLLKDYYNKFLGYKAFHDNFKRKKWHILILKTKFNYILVFHEQGLNKHFNESKILTYVN